MKFLIAFVALAAVAVASPLHKPIDTFAAELSAIIAAINHPSTDPATATLLQEQLDNIMAQLNPESISVGPAIVDPTEYEPISVGPAIIDGPIPSPAGPSTVQIVININTADVSGNPVSIEGLPSLIPSPVIVVEQPEITPEPVIVVEQPDISGEPVVVVDQPTIVEPVIVSPIAPVPVVVLPDILN